MIHPCLPVTLYVHCVYKTQTEGQTCLSIIRPWFKSGNIGVMISDWRGGRERGREGGLLLLTKAGDIGTQLSFIRTKPIKELSMLGRARAKDKGCYGN